MTSQIRYRGLVLTLLTILLTPTLVGCAAPLPADAQESFFADLIYI